MGTEGTPAGLIRDTGEDSCLFSNWSIWLILGDQFDRFDSHRRAESADGGQFFVFKKENWRFQNRFLFRLLFKLLFKLLELNLKYSLGTKQKGREKSKHKSARAGAID